MSSDVMFNGTLDKRDLENSQKAIIGILFLCTLLNQFF